MQCHTINITQKLSIYNRFKNNIGNYLAELSTTGLNNLRQHAIDATTVNRPTFKHCSDKFWKDAGVYSS